MASPCRATIWRHTFARTCAGRRDLTQPVGGDLLRRPPHGGVEPPTRPVSPGGATFRSPRSSWRHRRVPPPIRRPDPDQAPAKNRAEPVPQRALVTPPDRPSTATRPNATHTMPGQPTSTAKPSTTRYHPLKVPLHRGTRTSKTLFSQLRALFAYQTPTLRDHLEIGECRGWGYKAHAGSRRWRSAPRWVRHRATRRAIPRFPRRCWRRCARRYVESPEVDSPRSRELRADRGVGQEAVRSTWCRRSRRLRCAGRIRAAGASERAAGDPADRARRLESRSGSSSRRAGDLVAG